MHFTLTTYLIFWKLFDFPETFEVVNSIVVCKLLHHLLYVYHNPVRIFWRSIDNCVEVSWESRGVLRGYILQHIWMKNIGEVKTLILCGFLLYFCSVIIGG